MFAPKNSDAQIAYCYSDKEIAEALAEVGLTPTPLPERPFEVELPDGRSLRGRDEVTDGLMDQEGSNRTVLFVR